MGVLILRSGHANIDGLSTGLVQLSLRELDIGIAGYSTGEPSPGQRQVIFVLLHGVGEQALLGVEATKFEIVGGQLGAHAEIDVRQVSSGGLSGGPVEIPLAGECCPKDPAPRKLVPAENKSL